MGVIDTRYAEALLAAAGDPEEADRFGDGLQELSNVLQAGDAACHFFTAPHISAGIKKETVEKIFPREEWTLFNQFLFLLIDKKRIDRLTEICREYRRLKDERQNHLEIRLFSAMPLEESQVERIAGRFKKQYGAAVVSVMQSIDPALLGGVLIRIGDIRIDDTQLGRLKALEKNMWNPELNVR